jgi:hypothetical protein
MNFAYEAELQDQVSFEGLRQHGNNLSLIVLRVLIIELPHNLEVVNHEDLQFEGDLLFSHKLADHLNALLILEPLIRACLKDVDQSIRYV